jgi:hypothetical protein
VGGRTDRRQSGSSEAVRLHGVVKSWISERIYYIIRYPVFLLYSTTVSESKAHVKGETLTLGPKT